MMKPHQTIMTMKNENLSTWKWKHHPSYDVPAAQHVRFKKKYQKWYGVDSQAAQDKWDTYVRDSSVDRYYDEGGVLFLAAPVTGTSFKETGLRIGDKRSMQEERRISAADQEAIREERNRFLNQKCTLFVRLFAFSEFNWYCYCSITSKPTHQIQVQYCKRGSWWKPTLIINRNKMKHCRRRLLTAAKFCNAQAWMWKSTSAQEMSVAANWKLETSCDHATLNWIPFVIFDIVWSTMKWHCNIIERFVIATRRQNSSALSRSIGAILCGCSEAKSEAKTEISSIQAAETGSSRGALCHRQKAGSGRKGWWWGRWSKKRQE